MADASGGHLINTPEPIGITDVGGDLDDAAAPSPTREILRRTFKQKSAVFGLGLLIFILLTQLLGPYIRPEDPYHIDLSANAVYHAGPSLHPFHPFGTDDLGRDIFSRLLIGGRISITIAFLATGISLVIWRDRRRHLRVQAREDRRGAEHGHQLVPAFPFFLLALAIVAVRGPSAESVLIALGITRLGLVRPAAARPGAGVRETEYVEAARAAGAGG